MKPQHLKLQTALAKEEALTRLRESMDHETPGELTLKKAIHGTLEVIGWLQGNTLWLRRRSPYSSMFQPVLIASINGGSTGTVIEGDVAIQGAARGFYLWYALGVGLIGGIIFLAALIKIIQGHALPQTWIGLAVPALLALGAMVFRAVTLRMLRRDADFLTAHLQQTLCS